METIFQGKATLVRNYMPCCRCGKETEVMMLEQHWARFNEKNGMVVCSNCLSISEFEDEREMYAKSPTANLFLTDESFLDEEEENNYPLYLQSNHWKEFRKQALEYYGRKCRECGTTEGIMHVHHITYENIGNESLEDVVILCQSCHYKEHFGHKTRKYKKPNCWHDNIEPMIFRDKECYIGVWFCMDCRQMVAINRTLTPKEKRYIKNDKLERLKSKHKNNNQCEIRQVISFDLLPKKYKKEIPSYCRCRGEQTN